MSNPNDFIIINGVLVYNGPQDSDHSLEKLSEHGIMGKNKE